MSIAITLDSGRIKITQKFTVKELGSPRNMLKSAIEWLALGTEFERKKPKGKKKDVPTS